MDAPTKNFLGACEEYFKYSITNLYNTSSSQQNQIQELQNTIVKLQEEQRILEQYEKCCTKDLVASVEKSIHLARNYRRMYVALNVMGYM